MRVCLFIGMIFVMKKTKFSFVEKIRRLVLTEFVKLPDEFDIRF